MADSFEFLLETGLLRCEVISMIIRVCECWMGTLAIKPRACTLVSSVYRRTTCRLYIHILKPCSVFEDRVRGEDRFSSCYG